MDFLRHRFGRRELPDGVEKLAPRDREVFRLFHLEGFGVGEILGRMSRNGDRFEVDDLLAAIQRIEERIDRRTLQRCDYHRQARSRGTGSGRLLELLDHLMTEADLAAGGALPDAGLLLEEARDAEANIRRLIGLLPQEDRRVLDLKFVRNLSADEIARDIGLLGRRKAYTILSRALRRLRRLVLADGMAPGSGNGNGSDVSFPIGPRLARESEASD